MEQFKAYVDFMHMAVEFNMNKVGIQTRDERGAVSTEMAVTIAAFVAIAVAAGVIFIGKMRSNANNIPDTVPAPS